MRLLIAGGGTGGHIYPALAVARSLLDADARDGRTPELTWVGGHRGLELSLVPSARIPLRRLVLRSLRTVDLSSTLLSALNQREPNYAPEHADT